MTLRASIPGFLAAQLLFVTLAPAVVQAQAAPSSSQLEILKSLPPDQRSSVIDSVLGGASGKSSGKKSDAKLEMPDTVRAKGEENTDLLGKKTKTADGRPLRDPLEDPELRAEDQILIELAPKKEIETREAKAADKAKDTVTVKVERPTEAVLTDEQKKLAIEFEKRVAKGNPYRLNRFGVVEVPGMPAIPLAGLTSYEAKQRLSAEPEFARYDVMVTLLRLEKFGEEALKPFGYDLFQGSPSTFAPVTDIPVPGDYVVGPGDALDVQLYGNEPASYSLTVGRDGRVNFPKLGPIAVGGMSFEHARSSIEHRVSKQLIGTRVSISVGDLRTIRVFVLGEAEKPGSFLVSGLSTMTNALFVSGGVKPIGSLRSIELKRGGQLVSVLDLYDLLLKGDTSGDRKLLPGDVIFIPPVGKTVSVAGEVRRPAIYELKTEKNVAQLLALAGGLTPESDAKLAHLERILASGRRAVHDVDLTASSGRGAEIGNGDKLRVNALRPTLDGAVVLSGHVFRPGSFEYRAGLRLSDVLGSFDELRPNADRRYIMIQRDVPPEHRIAAISADLEKALAAKGGAADPELQARDQIYVFDLSNDRTRVVAPLIKDLELQGTMDAPAQIVTIDGRVKAPGRYPLDTGMRVSDLIRAGGSMQDAAFGGEAELTRYEVKDGNTRQTELVKIDLAAVLHGDAAADVALRPYDFLIIKETPEWGEQASIELKGEVRFPGKYPIQRGETLRSVLARAGGFTDLAFAEGAVFTRQNLKEREKEQIELLANRFQSDLTSLSLQALGNTSGNSTPAQAVAVGQQLIEELRATKPIGRLVINLRKVTAGGSTGDLVLKEGDQLIVPKKTQEVTILGEVQSPTSHIYQPGLQRDDYIGKSGGVTQKADRKRIYVVRANGSVISAERGGWFHRTGTVAMQPGDTIVVPLDAERIRPLPLWTAVTTIVYNLAVAARAIRGL
jgi:protein involved in polysaccharide export with SLBB domain